MLHTPLISSLQRALGRENVLSAPSELAVYDCDAFTIERCRPEAVVFPRSTEDVAKAVKVCGEHGAAVVARGAGTSLAGGCLPLANAEAARHSTNARDGGYSAEPLGGAVVLMLTRMNRILEIDLRNRMAVVEPGVTNLRLGQALQGSGYHYAPDPSSQNASTVGGNVATNAGGPHTLKYGVTVNHVLGLEAVLSDGAILHLHPGDNICSLDLTGLIVGSEGTLGIVTKVWVRLTPNPQDYRAMRATFNSLEDAGNAVSHIIAAGIVPAALELMDQGILAAVEEAYHFGFPPDAGAVLVIEVDGLSVGLDRQVEQIVDFCKRFGAREVLQATSADERVLLWKCRKMAVGATGRLSPSYTIQDGVVPRTKLPHIIRRTNQISKKYNIRIVNVAHAGDGNVHPILLFDESNREQVERAVAAGREILEECIACGGSITAEHGVGVEKIALMDHLFAPADLEAMRRVRAAFDPAGRLNPGKLIPPGTLNANEPAKRDSTISERPEDQFASARVIDYPADDMTVTVESGITIAELNRVLAEKRQCLPVDVAFPDKTTVGEAILFDRFGPREYAYGTMRDYLLGFTAVDGTGMTFSGGGRVVKNAAGYNMCRLMAGSIGMLGTIKQATLMVRPMPETAAIFSCEVSNFELAERLLASLVHLPVYPVAIELSAGRLHEGNPLFGPIGEGNVCRLCVGFEGMAVDVEWMLAKLRDEWTSLGMTAPLLIPGLPNSQYWQWTAEHCVDSIIHTTPCRLVGDVSRLLQESPDCSIHAHAGNGLIFVEYPAGFERPSAAPAASEHGEKRLPSPKGRVMDAIVERFNSTNISSEPDSPEPSVS
jgi:glycolate oxidase